MTARFAAVGFAVLYVLPLVLAVDALVRPRAAWRRIGRSKLLWVTAFAAAPVVGFTLRSPVPAVVVAGFSFFYLAKVRSLLDAATELELALRGWRVDAGTMEALTGLLFAIPFLPFLIIAATAEQRDDRLVALAFAVAGIGGGVGAVWWNIRRARGRRET